MKCFVMISYFHCRVPVTLCSVTEKIDRIFSDCRKGLGTALEPALPSCSGPYAAHTMQVSSSSSSSCMYTHSTWWNQKRSRFAIISVFVAAQFNIRVQVMRTARIRDHIGVIKHMHTVIDPGRTRNVIRITSQRYFTVLSVVRVWNLRKQADRSGRRSAYPLIRGLSFVRNPCDTRGQRLVDCNGFSTRARFSRTRARSCPVR